MALTAPARNGTLDQVELGWRAACWKSDLAASAAIEICRRILLTPESARLNARSARVAPTGFSPDEARTAVATWWFAHPGRHPHCTNIRHRRAASTSRMAAQALDNRSSLGKR